MKTLVINGDYLAFDAPAGVSRFATEILNELDRLEDSYSVVLLTPQYSYNLPNFERIKIVKYGSQPLLIWKQYVLPKYVRKKGGLLLDLTQAFPLTLRGIVCVHDCIPELFINSYGGLFAKTIRRWLKLLQRQIVIRRSHAILTVSEQSQNDIIRFFGVDKERIHIVPNAWQHIRKTPYDEGIIDKLGIHDKDFFFSLGSRVPHKNTEWIIAAALQNKQYIFVISGDNSFRKDFRKLRFPDNVIFTGYVTDEEIRTLMSRCKAFIFPSFYEGFGISPLEALSEGADIIISSTSCLPEIYGDAAYYIDPYNTEDIDINSILSQNIELADLVLEKYSWEKSAAILNKVVRGLLKS